MSFYTHHARAISRAAAIGHAKVLLLYAAHLNKRAARARSACEERWVSDLLDDMARDRMTPRCGAQAICLREQVVANARARE